MGIHGHAWSTVHSHAQGQHAHNTCSCTVKRAGKRASGSSFSVRSCILWCWDSLVTWSFVTATWVSCGLSWNSLFHGWCLFWSSGGGTVHPSVPPGWNSHPNGNNQMPGLLVYKEFVRSTGVLLKQNCTEHSCRLEGNIKTWPNWFERVKSGWRNYGQLKMSIWLDTSLEIHICLCKNIYWAFLQWPAYVISVKLCLKSVTETADLDFSSTPLSWEAAYFKSAVFWKTWLDVQEFVRLLNCHWSSGLQLNRNSLGRNWDKKAKSLILSVCSWVTFKIKPLHVCLPGQIMKLMNLVMPNSWRQDLMNLLDLRSWKHKKWLFATVIALRLFTFLPWELRKDECVLSLHSSVWEALPYRCLHALTWSEPLGFASAWENSLNVPQDGGGVRGRGGNRLL